MGGKSMGMAGWCANRQPHPTTAAVPLAWSVGNSKSSTGKATPTSEAPAKPSAMVWLKRSRGGDVKLEIEEKQTPWGKNMNGKNRTVSAKIIQTTTMFCCLLSVE